MVDKATSYVYRPLIVGAAWARIPPFYPVVAFGLYVTDPFLPR